MSRRIRHTSTMHDVQNEAGPSNTGLTRYVVQTSDVVQDLRVNVSEESSEKIIWYKERFLGDNEIVENVVHNATNRICWTIHRPLRGWYIRIRSPLFAPGVFIPLKPVPTTSPYHLDGSLSFKSRTGSPDNPPEAQFTLHEDADSISSTSSIHSYPPTPTTVIRVQPPSPGAPSVGPDAHPDLKKQKFPAPRPPPLPFSDITEFIMAPSSIQPTTHAPASASFFARAVSVLKSHRPSHSNSFTLSRLPSNTPLSPPPPYAQNLPSSSADIAQSSVNLTFPAAPLPPPLLVFHDRTPLLTVRSLTGLLELDRREERLLGVETSFWIAIALTYLEFLEEKESYLAALSD